MNATNLTNGSNSTVIHVNYTVRGDLVGTAFAETGILYSILGLLWLFFSPNIFPVRELAVHIVKKGWVNLNYRSSGLSFVYQFAFIPICSMLCIIVTLGIVTAVRMTYADIYLGSTTAILLLAVSVGLCTLRLWYDYAWAVMVREEARTHIIAGSTLTLALFLFSLIPTVVLQLRKEEYIGASLFFMFLNLLHCVYFIFRAQPRVAFNQLLVNVYREVLRNANVHTAEVEKTIRQERKHLSWLDIFVFVLNIGVLIIFGIVVSAFNQGFPEKQNIGWVISFSLFAGDCVLLLVYSSKEFVNAPFLALSIATFGRLAFITGWYYWYIAVIAHFFAHAFYLIASINAKLNPEIDRIARIKYIRQMLNGISQLKPVDATKLSSSDNYRGKRSASVIIREVEQKHQAENEDGDGEIISECYLGDHSRLCLPIVLSRLMLFLLFLFIFVSISNAVSAKTLWTQTLLSQFHTTTQADYGYASIFLLLVFGIVDQIVRIMRNAGVEIDLIKAWEDIDEANKAAKVEKRRRKSKTMVLNDISKRTVSFIDEQKITGFGRQISAWMHAIGCSDVRLKNLKSSRDGLHQSRLNEQYQEHHDHILRSYSYVAFLLSMLFVFWISFFAFIAQNTATAFFLIVAFLGFPFIVCVVAFLLILSENEGFILYHLTKDEKRRLQVLGQGHTKDDVIAAGVLPIDEEEDKGMEEEDSEDGEEVEVHVGGPQDEELSDVDLNESKGDEKQPEENNDTSSGNIFSCFPLKATTGGDNPVENKEKEATTVEEHWGPIQDRASKRTTSLLALIGALVAINTAFAVGGGTLINGAVAGGIAFLPLCFAIFLYATYRLKTHLDEQEEKEKDQTTPLSTVLLLYSGSIIFFIAFSLCIFLTPNSSTITNTNTTNVTNGSNATTSGGRLLNVLVNGTSNRTNGSTVPSILSFPEVIGSMWTQEDREKVIALLLALFLIPSTSLLLIFPRGMHAGISCFAFVGSLLYTVIISFQTGSILLAFSLVYMFFSIASVVQHGVREKHESITMTQYRIVIAFFAILMITLGSVVTHYSQDASFIWTAVVVAFTCITLQEYAQGMGGGGGGAGGMGGASDDYFANIGTVLRSLFGLGSLESGCEFIHSREIITEFFSWPPFAYNHMLGGFHVDKIIFDCGRRVVVDFESYKMMLKQSRKGEVGGGAGGEGGDGETIIDIMKKDIPNQGNTSSVLFPWLQMQHFVRLHEQALKTVNDRFWSLKNADEIVGVASMVNVLEMYRTDVCVEIEAAATHYRARLLRACSEAWAKERKHFRSLALACLDVTDANNDGALNPFDLGEDEMTLNSYTHYMNILDIALKSKSRHIVHRVVKILEEEQNLVRAKSLTKKTSHNTYNLHSLRDLRSVGKNGGDDEGTDSKPKAAPLPLPTNSLLTTKDLDAITKHRKCSWITFWSDPTEELVSSGRLWELFTHFLRPPSLRPSNLSSNPFIFLIFASPLPTDAHGKSASSSAHGIDAKQPSTEIWKVESLSCWEKVVMANREGVAKKDGPVAAKDSEGTINLTTVAGLTDREKSQNMFVKIRQVQDDDAKEHWMEWVDFIRKFDVIHVAVMTRPEGYEEHLLNMGGPASDSSNDVFEIEMEYRDLENIQNHERIMRRSYKQAFINLDKGDALFGRLDLSMKLNDFTTFKNKLVDHLSKIADGKLKSSGWKSRCREIFKQSHVEVSIVHESNSEQALLTDISRSRVTRRSYSNRHALHHETSKAANTRPRDSEALISLRFQDLTDPSFSLNESCFFYLPNIGGSYYLLVSLVSTDEDGLRFEDIDIDFRMCVRDSHFSICGIRSNVSRRKASGVFVQSLGESGYFSTIGILPNEESQHHQRRALMSMKKSIDAVAQKYNLQDTKKILNNQQENSKATKPIQKKVNERQQQQEKRTTKRKDSGDGNKNFQKTEQTTVKALEEAGEEKQEANDAKDKKKIEESQDGEEEDEGSEEESEEEEEEDDSDSDEDSSEDDDDSDDSEEEEGESEEENDDASDKKSS
eukprot:g2697.t1